MFDNRVMKIATILIISVNHLNKEWLIILAVSLLENNSWFKKNLIRIHPNKPDSPWSVSRSVMSNSCVFMDCSPPGSSAHGIFQTRILEWVVLSFSKGSSQSRDPTEVSCIAGRFFTIWATREAPKHRFIEEPCIFAWLVSLSGTVFFLV